MLKSGSQQNGSRLCITSSITACSSIYPSSLRPSPHRRSLQPPSISLPNYAKLGLCPVTQLPWCRPVHDHSTHDARLEIKQYDEANMIKDNAFLHAASVLSGTL
eukprot:7710575-Pyramimonas_sp.AAC.1